MSHPPKSSLQHRVSSEPLSDYDSRQGAGLLDFPTRWSLRRAKSIRQKIGWSHALAIGVAVIGSTFGHLLGDAYARVATRNWEAAHREERLLSSLNLAVLAARSHQQQFIPLLQNLPEFEHEHKHFLGHVQKIRGLMTEVQTAVVTHAQFSHASAELEAWLRTHDSTIEIYTEQLDQELRKIDRSRLQTANVSAAQQSLLAFTNSDAALELDSLSDDLTLLLDDVHAREMEADIAMHRAEDLHSLITYTSLLLSVVLAVVLALRTSQAIARPIEAVTQVAQRAAQESRFDLQAPALTDDEVGRLATAFNGLIRQVGQYTQELELSRQTLELRVTERTQELKQTIQELEEEISLRCQIQVALHKSEELFRSLSACSPVGIFLADVAGGLTYMNPRLQALSPKSTAANGTEVSWGASWMERVHPEDCDRVLSAWAEHIQQGGSYADEYRLQMPEGETRWVHARSSPLFADTGILLGHVGTVEDVTEQKQAEQEIRHALARERELNELRARFVTTVSHEFRTPLTVIVSSTELVQHYEHKMTLEKKQQHFEKIQTASRYITHLLDEVLLLSQASSSDLQSNPAPMDLEQFCRNLLEDMQVASFSSHTFRFRYQSFHPSVCLDERLLRYILTNLLSNAIKYSPHGSEVELEVTCDGASVTLSVQDQGIGIPAADQLHLFEAFHRAKNATNIPGVGLGLSIVKNCVDIQGGQITVESKTDLDTKFTVVLPLISQSHETQSQEI
ncbi:MULTISPECIES: ATP-binding protein [Trichocoleus]|uniref:histidine kinase n=1 Tax=Trichocoleus desertorum GB2-A4 TaxID=2933944 RepID=A0ABV0J9L2_9CYAN|nr:ATP-binding protein [Trichocoleus sp. FACHB-46]MBD1862796.1 PAS domain-containing protein [Trichocoleus sp. FACHB-46]